MNIIKNPITLDRNKTALLVIDIQERIYKAVRKHEKLIDNVLKLVKGAKLLNIPIYYTEQYPQGLGETADILKKELTGDAVQKLSFSCFGAENLFGELTSADISQVVISGVESHVCVQQTVLDLLANNFQVNLPVNAVSSRYKIDYDTAIRRMEKHGAEITTVESVLFELLQHCKVPEFKSISSLIK